MTPWAQANSNLCVGANSTCQSSSNEEGHRLN